MPVADNCSPNIAKTPVELVARKVGANLHVAYNGVYYSVPSALYKETVIVRASDSSVDIINSDGECVASHKRCFTKRRYVTDPSHMPACYFSVLDESCYDGAKLRLWAKDIGNNTFFIIDSLLKKRQVEEQAYKSCMAILQLSKKYGQYKLEVACRTARCFYNCSYTSIKNIILSK